MGALFSSTFFFWLHTNNAYVVARLNTQLHTFFYTIKILKKSELFLQSGCFSAQFKELTEKSREIVNKQTNKNERGQ